MFSIKRFIINLKKYEESYLYLFQNNIIKSLEEFGEFLLVVNGFDKSVIGHFLSNTHAPNEKKEVLRGPNGMPLLGDIISGKNIANNNNTNPPVL